MVQDSVANEPPGKNSGKNRPAEKWAIRNPKGKDRLPLPPIFRGFGCLFQGSVPWNSQKGSAKKIRNCRGNHFSSRDLFSTSKIVGGRIIWPQKSTEETWCVQGCSVFKNQKIKTPVWIAVAYFINFNLRAFWRPSRTTLLFKGKFGKIAIIHLHLFCQS